MRDRKHDHLRPRHWHRVLAYLPEHWLTLVLDLAFRLRSLLCLKPPGPYEILDYEATLELLDRTGRRARFQKRERVKFLQDHMIAIEDFTWGDGEILKDYQCSPGIVVDKYCEGDRWNILVSLRESKSSGDIEEFHIEQLAQDSFVKDEEWLQTEIRRSTRHLRMEVIFPANRYCRRAVLVQRKSNRAIELGPDHFHILPDRRQLVAWESNCVRGYEIYTLRWRW